MCAALSGAEPAASSSDRKPLGQSAQKRLDIRAENRKLNAENVMLMQTVLEYKKAEERHHAEVAGLQSLIEAKDEKIAGMEAAQKDRDEAHRLAMEAKDKKIDRMEAALKDRDDSHRLAMEKLEAKLTSKHEDSMKSLESKHARAVAEQKEEAARKLTFDRSFYQQQINLFDLDSKKKLENAKAEQDVEVKKARLQEKSEGNEWKVRAMVAEDQLTATKAQSSGAGRGKKAKNRSETIRSSYGLSL